MGEQHEKYCGSLTVECELCGDTVTRKWLQNHLASEHNINPTLQTNLVNTIIHSNLGLDQEMDWKRNNGKAERPTMNEEEDEREWSDEDVHDFVCPFCQKYPPKSQDFGEHLASCSANQMEED